MKSMWGFLLGFAILLAAAWPFGLFLRKKNETLAQVFNQMSFMDIFVGCLVGAVAWWVLWQGRAEIVTAVADALYEFQWVFLLLLVVMVLAAMFMPEPLALGEKIGILAFALINLYNLPTLWSSLQSLASRIHW